ncbi:glycosyl transferase family 39 [Synechocystis sp. LKSZ1]
MIFIIVLIISYFNYFRNYDYPAGAFWDENYYIASAQKYLNHIFFLHEHPPLGHMLIALGEKIIKANILSDQFIDLEKVGEFPKNFSFAGYRLLPVLCAWLTPAIFLLILLLLTQNYFISFTLSLLYLFDNALIVHSRGAMLDAPLMLFVCLTILFFLLALRWQRVNFKLILFSIGLGISFAFTVTTKYQGGILLLLFPVLYWGIWPHWKKCLYACGFSLGSFYIVFLLIWQLHFSLGTDINPQLKNKGYFTPKTEYQIIIADKNHLSPWYLPMMLRIAFDYTVDVNKGIPPLNLCKKDENGSPAFFWPVGARAINYRWETLDDGQSYRYLYLQVNPVVWGIGLWGVIATSGLVLTTLFFPLKESIKNRFLMLTFLGLYWAYMLIMSRLERVTYLYHYFPALLFSFCLFALWIKEVKRVGAWSFNRRKKMITLSILAMVVIIAYYFYSPFTYFQPLTDTQFRQRMIFPLWDLRCVKCERTSFFKPL